MTTLATKKCVLCAGGTPPLAQEQIKMYLAETGGEWKYAHEEGVDKIRREFQFSSFAKAMEFVNKIAAIAESQQHHPDIHIWYRKVLVVLSTHAIKGLSENDFILAAKINGVV